MVGWHVLWQCRLAEYGRTNVQSDLPVFVAETDRSIGDSDIQLLSDKLVRHTVEVTLHPDVIVHLYPSLLPNSELVRLGREWRQCWSIESKIL